MISFSQGVLFMRLVLHSLGMLGSFIKQRIAPPRLPPSETPKNIVIVGASFAGYHAARFIAGALPPGGNWRLVIVEPNAHYQFTWTLPRFCVIEGHEEKTFIPYGGYLPPSSRDLVRWVHHHASAIGPKSLTIRETGEEIPYEYLVIATGSGVGLQLPSRVGATGKEEGCELLRGIQRKVKEAGRLVVIGGGAAGVELATDAKQLYPEKTVVLVHSRQAVMHRFGPELQATALKGLEDLGVDVILGERATDHDGYLTLTSGRKVEYDFCVNCGGQKPASELLRDIAPGAITESGHIRVKPTLQVDDDSLPNVYACGDVAETGVRNANARAAMSQAQYAASNVILAAQGRTQSHLYSPHWEEGVIKLTLGLDKSVVHFSDGKTELLMHGKEKDETLMVAQTWSFMGEKPFEDHTVSGEEEEEVNKQGDGDPKC